MSNSSVSTTAGKIRVDGTTNTGLDRTQNNTPLVNIVSPNANGLSHNKYLDFNVGNKGVVINNSANIGVSQIGGVVYANPNFKDMRKLVSY